MVTPGFLKDGIDFEQLVYHYWANDCYVKFTNNEEVSLITCLMEHVIGTSIGYQEDKEKIKEAIQRRFQMIVNSTQEELVAEKAGLIKRSSAVWTLAGSYESGTDFKSNNGKQIETKVYFNRDNMLDFAEKGSHDYTVFHGADYVLCYLINSYDARHWYWLKKINGIYDVYYDEELYSVTDGCLPSSIPICYCRIRDDSIIIDKNTFCT